MRAGIAGIRSGIGAIVSLASVAMAIAAKESPIREYR